VGERSLDSLLESKEALNRELTELITAELSAAGTVVTRAGIKDLILARRDEDIAESGG
jgi:hypothetical protein